MKNILKTACHIAADLFGLLLIFLSLLAICAGLFEIIQSIWRAVFG